MTDLNLNLSINPQIYIESADLNWELQIYIKFMDLNLLNLQIYIKSVDFVEIHTSVWALNGETS